MRRHWMPPLPRPAKRAIVSGNRAAVARNINKFTYIRLRQIRATSLESRCIGSYCRTDPSIHSVRAQISVNDGP